ncbi:MAG: class I SAM-dependent methyltransferase [Cuniculiplasma sp.]
MKEEEVNKNLWDELARVHVRSQFYDIDSFLKGRNRLREFEIKELGNVKKKKIIHLMCHIGLDSLSLVRMGGEVTAVDFSSESIKIAKELSEKAGIRCKFIQSDISSVLDHVKEKFDVVYTSIGVLAWIRDLNHWAKTVSELLREGGFFYMAEIHPFTMLISEYSTVDDLRISNNYFYPKEAQYYSQEGSYADRSAKVNAKGSYQWERTISDVINSLISNGIELDYIHEFPFTCWPQFNFLHKESDGYFTIPDKLPRFPLLFSVKGHKK